MDDIIIRQAPHAMPAALLNEIVTLYNRSLSEVYGFFPITAEHFAARVIGFASYRPDLFLHAFAGERLVGMLHAGIIRHSGYDPAGTIEMMGVDPDWRGKGIGGKLLDEALTRFLRERGLLYIDGSGAFPNTPFYSTLLNGSERSGVELDDWAMVGLLESRGFARGRESIIMRADLSEELPPLPKRFIAILQDCDRRESVRRPEETWFDQVFRGWTLTESQLFVPYLREPVTRAVYVPMRDLSAWRGVNTYGVFAVNTHQPSRGRGWATAHFRILRNVIRAQGGEKLELHVYSDNLPAVKLYETSGFREVKRTAMFRLDLRP